MTDKICVSLLIVDDERNRDQIYRDFIDEFNRLAAEKSLGFSAVVEIPDEPALLPHKIRKSAHYDLILLDQILDEGVWNDQRDSIIDAIVESGIPVVLVSSNFNDAAARISMTRIAALRKNPILGYFSFTKMFSGFSENSSGFSLTREHFSNWAAVLAGASGLSLAFRPASRSEIKILHLTDSHFGRPGIDPADLEIPYLASIMARRTDASAATGRSIAADLLLWSGDISNTAAPYEYIAAKHFLDDIRRQGLVGENAPMLFIPGNHDFSWPLMLASRIHLAGDRQKYEFVVGDKAQPNQKALAIYGYEPFQQFSERCTGTRCSIVQGFDLDIRFIHCGFAVLRLYEETHSVPSRSGAKAQPVLKRNEWLRAVREAWSAIQAECPENTCILIVTHRAEHQTKAVREERNAFFRMVSDRHPTILVAGHTHSADVVARTGISTPRMLVVTGAPYSDKADVDALRPPSIGTITLRNPGRENLEVTLTWFVKDRHGWHPSAITYRLQQKNQWIEI